jgi:hypothetical protein
LCRPRLDHPSRQQRSRAIGLLDDKVAATTMLQTTYDSHALTRTRVMRVSNQNVKTLFLGSMSWSRKEQ